MEIIRVEVIQPVGRNRKFQPFASCLVGSDNASIRGSLAKILTPLCSLCIGIDLRSRGYIGHNLSLALHRQQSDGVKEVPLLTWQLWRFVTCLY